MRPPPQRGAPLHVAEYGRVAARSPGLCRLGRRRAGRAGGYRASRWERKARSSVAPPARPRGAGSLDFPVPGSQQRVFGLPWRASIAPPTPTPAFSRSAAVSAPVDIEVTGVAISSDYALVQGLSRIARLHFARGRRCLERRHGALPADHTRRRRVAAACAALSGRLAADRRRRQRDSALPIAPVAA